jgi:hypothetical protein
MESKIGQRLALGRWAFVGLCVVGACKGQGPLGPLSQAIETRMTGRTCSDYESPIDAGLNVRTDCRGDVADTAVTVTRIGRRVLSVHKSWKLDGQSLTDGFEKARLSVERTEGPGTPICLGQDQRSYAWTGRQYRTLLSGDSARQVLQLTNTIDPALKASPC